MVEQNERKVVRRCYYFCCVKAGLGAVVGTVSAGWHAETLTSVLKAPHSATFPPTVFSTIDRCQE